MFSETANHFQGTTNSLYRERDALLTRGEKIIDLVSGNVHHHGILYPQSLLEKALSGAAAQARIYRPHPLGQPAARESVSCYYQREGLSISPEQIVLTPGTSISYWYAFKLLADPGDEILCPQPTYPLFDAIAALAGVRLTYYRMNESPRWSLDLEELESKIGSKTRAVILISPHNPTGAVATGKEVEGLAALAARHRLPIISDEVFSPFLFREKPLPRPAAGGAPLVITLNGFSKMLALPGIKIGWMAITGEPSLVRKSIGALETISDTFLPVNEAAQFAVPALLKEGESFSAFYADEIRKRAERTVALLSQTDRLSFNKPEGGFYIAVRIDDPRVDEDRFALTLLRRHGVLIHPGYFYDLPPSYFVISFVAEEPMMKTGLEKIAACLDETPER